jgi:predicted branched-subunit amino acid permease
MAKSGFPASPPSGPPVGLPSGAAEALGAPALAMAATFLAFGAAVREAGLGLAWALGAAWLVYGMPGQLVLLHFAVPLAPSGAVGGGVVPAVAAASAANARFLPMAVALAPWLGGGWRRWLALPFIAITPWAAAMRRLPLLPGPERLGWFLGFGLASWLVAGLATALGHLVAPWLGGAARSALLFTNPLYFALLLTLDLQLPARGRAARLGVLGGVLAAPVALLLPPAWGLLGAGLLGGTAAFLGAFLLDRQWGQGRGRGRAAR